MTVIRYVNVGLRWNPLDCPEADRVSARLQEVFESWEDTPYSGSILARGRGANCVGWVARVLDELHGRAPSELPDIPTDAAMHKPSKARSAMRWFFRQYPKTEVVSSLEVQPGDVVISGPRGGGPGHALFVGPRRNTLWQCSTPGVHYTGIYLPHEYELHEVRRFVERSWL